MGKEIIRDLATQLDPEVVTAAVESYLEENPVSADEPLLMEHIADPTPHPVYDDLPNGHFLTSLRNGLA